RVPGERSFRAWAPSWKPKPFDARDKPRLNSSWRDAHVVARATTPPRRRRLRRLGRLRNESGAAPHGKQRRRMDEANRAVGSEFVSREEVPDLGLSGLGRVGAVHGVLADVGAEGFADGALRRLRRIGRTHQLTVARD